MVILETGLSRPDAPSPHKRLGFGYRLASPGLVGEFQNGARFGRAGQG